MNTLFNASRPGVLIPPARDNSGPAQSFASNHGAPQSSSALEEPFDMQGFHETLGLPYRPPYANENALREKLFRLDETKPEKPDPIHRDLQRPSPLRTIHSPGKGESASPTLWSVKTMRKEWLNPPPASRSGVDFMHEIDARKEEKTSIRWSRIEKCVMEALRSQGRPMTEAELAAFLHTDEMTVAEALQNTGRLASVLGKPWLAPVEDKNGRWRLLPLR